MPPLEPWRIVTQLVAVPLLLAYCLAHRRRTDLHIIAVCIVAMTVYGVVQDQFSARLCPEYFTVGHPPIEGLTDPTLLGLAWGFLGAWWGGLLMGASLGLTATLGDPATRLSLREVLPGVGVVMGVIALGTLLAGASAWVNGGVVGLSLGGPLGQAVPEASHRAFFTVACAHFGTYVTAVAGSVALCLLAAWQRRARAGDKE